MTPRIGEGSPATSSRGKKNMYFEHARVSLRGIVKRIGFASFDVRSLPMENVFSRRIRAMKHSWGRGDEKRYWLRRRKIIVRAS